MGTLLVMETVAFLVSVCELAWFLTCTLLVIVTMACLLSECELPGL